MTRKIIEEPSKEDTEQARKNVLFALDNFKADKYSLDFTINRMMEMITGAYKQGQGHVRNICDFCRQPLFQHSTCAGCGELIHGEVMDSMDGKFFHGRECTDMYFERIDS